MKNKSLMEELEEEERKEKETQAKKAKEAVLHALSIHPLASESRDIRDAYLYGLVFAAIADDGKVDVAETAILFEIAKALSLPEGEVEEAISELQVKRPKDKMQLIAECVNALTDNKVGLNLFWAQFIQVWSSHADSKDNLCHLLKKIAERSGAGLPASKVSAILSLAKGGDGVDKDLFALADWMGDGALKYFAVKKYGDVSERLANARRKRRLAADRREKARAKAKERMQRQVEVVLSDVADAYCGKASIYQEALVDVSERVKEIDADLIDWVALVDDILKPIVIRVVDSWISSSNKRRMKCRAKVWKVVALLMMDRWEAKLSQMTNELNVLLSANCIGGSSWQTRLEVFVEEYLNDRVKLVDRE